MADAVTQFRQAKAKKSLRQFARERGVPVQSLSYWLKRHDQIAAAPEVKAFFESPAGLAFLHMLQIGLHVCFTKVGAASPRNITQFLRYTGLDQFVASSVGSQHQLSCRIDELITEFGEQETRSMASRMPEKLICVAEDETFHPDKMCLVVIEPVSNYIVLECYADKRDSKTWTKLVDEALEGLRVKVVWQTSDEAKGLLHHAQVGLQAPHAPDLFHIQQEIVKGCSRALGAIEQKAEERLQELMAKTPKPVSAGGRQLRFEPSLKLQQEQLAAGMERARAYSRCRRVRAARKDISDAYHPYDLSSGKPQSGQTVLLKLDEAFKTIETETAHLGEGCRKRIQKAGRLRKKVAETIAFFFVLVQQIIEQATCSEPLRQELRTTLIPGFYLTQVAQKEQEPKRRQAIASKAAELLQAFHQRAGPFAGLTDAESNDLEKTARDCAGLFQRSSSCVEGRNAQLARYHRGFHRLSDRRLSALTVIHNYLIKRPDGTTPTERFFENGKHGDLFQWLVDRVDLPSRPRNRKKNTSKSAA